MEKERKYISEADKKNSEGAMNYIKQSKNNPISFEEAQKQVLKNCKDNLPETKNGK